MHKLARKVYWGQTGILEFGGIWYGAAPPRRANCGPGALEDEGGLGEKPGGYRRIAKVSHSVDYDPGVPHTVDF